MRNPKKARFSSSFLSEARVLIPRAARLRLFGPFLFISSQVGRDHLGSRVHNSGSFGRPSATPSLCQVIILMVLESKGSSFRVGVAPHGFDIRTPGRRVGNIHGILAVISARCRARMEAHKNNPHSVRARPRLYHCLRR